MFHLFKRAYIDYDFLFTSLYPSILASDSALQNPLAPELLIQQDSLENLLKNKYESNVENLWKEVINQGTDKRFYLYLTKQDFFKFQIQLWKSTLSDTTLESCYFFHSLSTQDFLLKTHFYSDNVESKVNYCNSEIDTIELEEFSKAYESTLPCESLSELSPIDLSFENLLANFLSKNTNPSIIEAFFKKLEYFCWKFFISEIEILKGDMINGVYDYAKKSNKIKNFIQDSSSLVHLIKSDTKLMWLLDETLISGNPEYIRATYPMKIFVDFINMQSDINQFNKSESDSNEKVTKLMEYIYNGDYLKALELDISKGFGSYLFNNSCGHKVNLILISYLYDMHREGNIQEIKRFIVKV